MFRRVLPHSVDHSLPILVLVPRGFTTADGHLDRHGWSLDASAYRRRRAKATPCGMSSLPKNCIISVRRNKDRYN